MTLPAEFTATSAPTITPDGSVVDAVPTPPFSTPAQAPTPAPTVPTGSVAPSLPAAALTAAYPNSAVGRLDQPPTSRSKITAPGTIGTTPPDIATPRSCSSSQRITPSAAANP